MAAICIILHRLPVRFTCQKKTAQKKDTEEERPAFHGEKM